MTSIPDLTENLSAILAFELARGNTVIRVDRPAGSRCPLAVILAQPLDIAGFKANHVLSTGVDTWENRDSHYPLEAGYICERTRHVLAGPLG
ncbi:MAG: hypothetical protein QM766_07195 [Burkholderiaceae bacterium]